MNRVHARSYEAVSLIPDDRVAWRTRPGEFSLGEIALHIANCRLMNIASIRGDRPRYRGHEIPAGATTHDLQKALLRTSKTTIARLSDADLTAEITAASGARSPAWQIVLGGLIEHETHHRSQLCEALSAAGIPPPPLYGLHAEDLPR